jgi:hypothetical protein
MRESPRWSPAASDTRQPLLCQRGLSKITRRRAMPSNAPVHPNKGFAWRVWFARE